MSEEVQSEETAVEGCAFRRGEGARADFWRGVAGLYRVGLHCDLHLVCPGGEAVPCHRLVLAAASPMMRRALRMTTATEEERVAAVNVPDHQHLQVKRAVDALYTFLAREEDQEKEQGVQALGDEVHQEVLATLQIDLVSLCLNHPLKMEEEEEEAVKREGGGGVDVDVQIREGSGGVKRGWDEGDEVGEGVEEGLLEEQEEEYEEEEEDGDWYEQEKKRRRRRDNKRKVNYFKEEEEDDYWGEEEEYSNKKPVLSATSTSTGGGRRKRVKRAPALVEKKFVPRRGRDGAPVPTPEELYAQMSSCSGEVRVEMQDEPLSVPQHIRAKYRVRTVYQTMMGLRRREREAGEDETTYDAMPLAWSILGDSEDVIKQYKTICRAYISVLGFSDMEAYYDAQVYSRQGIFRQNNNHKTRYALRKQFAKASREELESLLRRDDVVAATARRTPRPPLPVAAESARMVLDPSLTPEDLDGIAFMAFFDNGEVSGWLLRVNELKRQEDTADCVKAAFEIWSRLKKDPKSKYFFMPRSPEMCQMYDRYINPCETFVVAQEFLRDVDGKHREKLLTKEKQCHECGLVFSLTNINEEQKFINHKRMHYIKNFKCDCDVTFKNYPEKKTHFQLFHSDGKFAKCEQCSFVANPEAVRRHFEKWHSDGADKEYVCPTCGVTAKNKHGYYFHMMTHKVYKCEVCGESVTGHKKLVQHRRRAHPQKPEEHPCGQCGKVYASERKLKEHNFRMHVPDKDRPYPCPDCDRGFARSLELSQHRMQAHIRFASFSKRCSIFVRCGFSCFPL